MKKLLQIMFLMAFMQTNMTAQNIGINATGALPNSSAMLDISATNKGMLVPRMTSSQRVAITAPAVGLLVFDNQTSSFWFYNGAAWTELSVGNNGWGLTGNAGINPSMHFVGTTDEKPLRFKVNNSWAGEIHPTSLNVFLGINAGVANTLGTANTAIGEQSLAANTEGNFNAASGYGALAANTTGYNNTAHGAYALFNNTVGRFNTAVGRNALFANTLGNDNTAYGEGAMLGNVNGMRNVASGKSTLYTNGSGNDNVAIGVTALYSNTTGGGNVASGSGSLYSNTTGIGNVAAGYHSLFSNSTGNYNNATGYSALAYNTSGTQNIAYGFESLRYNTTGGNNSAVGTQALTNNSTGHDNTATGYQALHDNTTGFYNTAIGTDALTGNTTGNANTAVGVGALHWMVSGSGNIAIGFNAGVYFNSPALYNTVGIGNDDLLNQAPNQVIIGNSSTVAIGGKVGWTTISDARVKNNITEDVKGLDFIMKLRPVTYHIGVKAMNTITGNKETPDFPGKYDGEKIQYTGFLAQEVEQAARDARYDFSGVTPPKDKKQFYTLTYETFVVPLVKAAQEQQGMIDKQQIVISDLQSKLKQMREELNILKTTSK